MKKLVYIISLLVLSVAIPNIAYAQDEPIMIRVKRDESHPVLRGFSELASGTAFGGVAAGIRIITGVVGNRYKYK